uniref:NADH-ubiquinone oxidoreductase chain 4L n=1 Tax=Cephalodiscus hodgsoni TaxID=560606 RepID=A0A481P7U9_9BILA|nr:NADH dehydrogenase subunit 4L [Cephalodiscus hodgsoni]
MNWLLWGCLFFVWGGGIIGLGLFHVSVISFLVCVELVMLSVIVFVCLIGYKGVEYCMWGIIILFISVCEAGVGLSLVVFLSRVYGSSQFRVLSGLRW